MWCFVYTYNQSPLFVMVQLFLEYLDLFIKALFVMVQLFLEYLDLFVKALHRYICPHCNISAPETQTSGSILARVRNDVPTTQSVRCPMLSSVWTMSAVSVRGQLAVSRIVIRTIASLLRRYQVVCTIYIRSSRTQARAMPYRAS